MSPALARLGWAALAVLLAVPAAALLRSADPAGLRGAVATGSPGGPETPLIAGDASSFGESPPGEVTADGRYVQTVPISVPAFHGLEPSVGLRYDSRHGAGVAGWGWQLTGDATVQRTSRGRGTPRMDGTDEFQLDGERLLDCSGLQRPSASCAAGGTHAAEHEDYQRLTYRDGTWTTWDRKGTKSTLLSWPGRAHNIIFGLQERSDTHGDTVTYRRFCDGDDACYLKTIEYGDADDALLRTRVEFFYEPRPDPVTLGLGAQTLTTRYRLLSVAVTTSGRTRSATMLAYQPGWDSRLASVTRYGTDAVIDHTTGRVTAGTAMPVERFAWAASGPDTQTPVARKLTGDVFQPEDNMGPAYADSVTDTGLPINSAPPAEPLPYYGDKQFLSADVNGDGRTDHITAIGGAYRAKDNLPMALEVRLRRADGTYALKTVSTTWPLSFEEVGAFSAAPANRLLTGDVNGDGRADLVSVHFDPALNTAVAEAALADPDGDLVQRGQVTVGTSPGWNARFRWFLGDHDGDGRDDLLRVYGVEAGAEIHAEISVALSDGKQFGAARPTSTTWSYEERDDAQWFAGDADGDRRVDLLSVESTLNGNGQRTATLRLALSGGDGTFTLHTQPTSEPFDSPIFTLPLVPPIRTMAVGELAQPGDFDGDGRTDLVLLQPHVTSNCPAGQLFCSRIRITTVLYRLDGKFSLQSDDTSVDGRWMNTTLRQISGIATVGANRWIAADVNGDGRTDLSAIGPAASVFDPAQWPTTVRIKRIVRGDNTWLPRSDEDLPWFFTCLNVAPISSIACSNGPPANDIAITDVNGDGHGDLQYTSPDADFTNYLIRVRPATNDLAPGLGRLADVSGEGREDWVYVHAANPGLTVYTATISPDGATAVTRRPLAAAAGFQNVDMRRWQVADFGSISGGPDGKADLLYLDREGGDLRSTVLFSVGLGNYAVVTRTARADEKEPDVRPWTPADVNGDGAVDLVRVLPLDDHHVTLTTLLADGKGGWSERNPPAPLTVSRPFYGSGRLRPADIDGDGFVDLVHAGVDMTAPGAPIESATVFRSDGTGGFTAGAFDLGAPTAAATAWQVAELNGDGRSDLVRLTYAVSASVRTTVLETLRSRGSGQFDPGRTSLGITDLTPRWSPADLDGDGCDEVSWVNSDWTGNPGFGFVRRLTNNCSVLTPDRSKLSSPAPAVHGWNTIDLSGDTTRQLFRVVAADGGPESTFLPLGVAPRLMTAASSGLGRVSRLTYGSSAGSHDGVPPGTSVAVVRARSETAGFPSAPEETRYTFAGLRYSYALQRLLGFNLRDAVTPRGHESTAYARTPGCPGTAVEKTLFTPQNVLLLDERTRYNDSSSAPVPWTCTPLLARRFECAGAADCRELRTRFEYDTYGNVTTLTEQGVYRDTNLDGKDDEPADNRTQTTTFVPNLTAFITSLPATRRTAAADGAVAAEESYIYDANVSPAQAPTVGDRTAVRTREPHLGADVTTRYGYDEHGNVKSETDATNHVTTTIWDPLHHRFPETVCNGKWCDTTVWDTVLGVPLRLTDGQQLTTTTSWDTFGRHMRTDLPDGGCTAHQYSNWGDAVQGQQIVEQTCVVAGATTPDNMLSRTEYFDGYHRVYRADRSGGHRRTRGFVANTILVERESAWAPAGQAGPVARYQYDGLDRLVLQLRPDNTVVTYVYGPGSADRADETSRHVVRRSDGLGRVTRVEDTGTGAPAITTVLGYDVLDQLRSSTGPGGTSTFDVGPLGWTWRECDPDRGCVSRTFDAAGRVSSETNAADQTVELGHDQLGRLVGKTHREHGAVVDTAIWSWDVDPVTGTANGYSLGQVTQTSRQSSAATVTRSYDKRGRIATERTCVAATCVSTEKKWDPAGRIQYLRYPDRSGLITAASEQVDYGYDDAGRVSSVGAYADEIAYTPQDEVASIHYGNGVTEVVARDSKRAWADRITLTGMAGSMSEMHTDYYHDSAGRISGEDRSGWFGYQKRYGNDQHSFGDAYGRLAQESTHLKETYGYDGQGRPAFRSLLGTYSYGDAAHADAVTAAGPRAYGYDDAGRMTSTPATSAHRWDADGNLLGLTTAKNGVVTYGYDADGNRVSREVPSLLRKTIYAGPVEIDGDWGEPKKSYLLGDRLLARSFFAWNDTGDPADAPGVRYYHHDVRGSVAAVTLMDGHPLQFYDYEPYGTAHDVGATYGEDVTFTGARRDEDSGFLRLGDRDYDPAIGRFLSPDSVVPDTERAAGYDRYAYGYHDPINTTDPSGHEAEPLQFDYTPFDMTLATSTVSVSSAPRSARLLDRGLRLGPAPAVEDTEQVARPPVVDPFGPPVTIGLGVSADAQVFSGVEAGAYYVFDTQANSGLMFSFAVRAGLNIGAGAGFGAFGYYDATVPQTGGEGMSLGLDTPVASGSWAVSCQTANCAGDVRHGLSFSKGIGFQFGPYVSYSWSYLLMVPDNPMSAMVQNGRQEWGKGNWSHTPPLHVLGHGQ